MMSGFSATSLPAAPGNSSCVLTKNRSSIRILRRDTRPRPPAVAPAGTRRRRHVIPETAVLVVGDDHRHLRPLRARAQARKHVGDVLIAPGEIGVAGMLIDAAGRLVEGDRGQRA